MELKINGEQTDLAYCQKHGEWFYIDDEMNCCAREEENNLHDEK